MHKCLPTHLHCIRDDYCFVMSNLTKSKKRRAAERAARKPSDGSNNSKGQMEKRNRQSTPTNLSQEETNSQFSIDVENISTSSKQSFNASTRTTQKEDTTCQKEQRNNQTHAISITFGKQYPNFQKFAVGLKQLGVSLATIAVQTGVHSFNVVLNSIHDLNKVLSADDWEHRPSSWRFEESDTFVIQRSEDVYSANKQETKSFIVKNVPLYIEMEDFRRELDCEIPDCKVFRITSAATGNLTTLVRVVTNDMDGYARALEEGIHVMYQTFRCEEPHQKMRINQCTNCYSYNHRFYQCPNKTVCVKCGRSGHIAKMCDSAIEKCVNCEGYHKSNARNCPKRKEVEEKVERRQSYANIVKAPQPNYNIGRIIPPTPIKLYERPLTNYDGFRDTENIRRFKNMHPGNFPKEQETETTETIKTVHTEALKKRLDSLTIEQLVTIIVVTSVEIKRHPDIRISQIIREVQAALVFL